jgi:hypothetical protein
MGSHRLVDPIVAVLSFAASDPEGGLDLRRLRRLEGTPATLPFWVIPTDVPVADGRPASVTTQ